MKLIILAFFISIFLHFTFFYQYKDKKIEKNSDKIENKTTKTNITFVKLKKIEKIDKKPKNIVKKDIKKVVKTPKINKTVKKIKKKKLVKKKPIKKTHKKVVKKRKQINNSAVVKKAQEFQKIVLEEQVVEKKKTIEKKTLESFLSQKDPIDSKTLSMIERLYGREFESYTKVQKAFIKDNINSFQIITQRTLDRMGYPPIAAKMRLGGVNIVEFLLHPNGDISKLKISSSSGYSVLDEFTLDLINFAYKDYPKPKTTTKLKFNVIYKIY